MEEKAKVLIVDDDSFNITQLLQILQSEYKVYVIKDGMSALQKADKSPPNLILLDINMPGMNGFDVLSELKTSDKTKDIPVIFISGIKNEDVEGKGLSSGAVDFIRKPFDPVVVKHKVRNQIQVINLRRELEELKKSLHACNSGT